MKKNRLEAFSDGVLAIVITIMVLEFKVPEESELKALTPVIPKFISYVLSFIYLAIYWNNHHHMLHTLNKVTGRILWANFHLLFWLSLIPFTTAWLGENQFERWPMAIYGIVLFMCGIAYWILQTLILKNNNESSVLKNAIGNDWKGKSSLMLYAIAIAFTFYNYWVSGVIYLIVALMWLIPDSRIEKLVKTD